MILVHNLKEGIAMGKWNEQAAPNNNLPSNVVRKSRLPENKQQEKHEFSEELADSGERNKAINKS